MKAIDLIKELENFVEREGKEVEVLIWENHLYEAFLIDKSFVPHNINSDIPAVRVGKYEIGLTIMYDKYLSGRNIAGFREGLAPAEREKRK